MSTQHEVVDLQELLGATGPFPIEAYHFVREGLSYTAEHVHGECDALPDVNRHVSGQQLCLGLRDFAISRYGLLAPAVLEHWKIRRTQDFGRIVFAMIDANVMSRTAEDREEDFRAVFDFREAFSDDELLADLAGGGRSPV